MSYKVTTEVSSDTIWNAMVDAFEGASLYWVHSAKLVTASNPPKDKKVVWWGDKELWAGEYVFVVEYEDPEGEEGNQDGRKIVDETLVLRGLQFMADSFPTDFGDLVSENDGRTTHDVLLQCIVLGDIIYD